MKGGKSKGLLAFMLIIGAVLGGIVGESLLDSAVISGIAPYLVKQYAIFDLPPVTIDLHVVKFLFGFSLHPNLISLIGMGAALLLFRRL